MGTYGCCASAAVGLLLRGIATNVSYTNVHGSVWNLPGLFPSFLGSLSPSRLFIAAIAVLCVLTVSFLSPYSQEASVWGRDTQEKHETREVPCHEEFGWLISCSWVFGSLLEVCGLWMWSAALQSVGWSLGEGGFPLQRATPYLGAPGRAVLPVGKSQLCIWMG